MTRSNEFLIGERQRQREKSEEWLEKCHARRDRPYWKNDSDYDELQLIAFCGSLLVPEEL